MTERLFLEGKNFISVADAIVRSGYAHNHVTRLCREGKVEGKKVGATWYVAEDSLEEFLARPETLVEDGKRYVLAAEAAKTIGYARDYVLELCREERIDAKKVNGSWMVEEDSVKRFFLDQQRMRLVRDSEQAKARREARIKSLGEQSKSTFQSDAVVITAPKELSHYKPHRRSSSGVRSAALFAVVVCILVNGYNVADAYRHGTLAYPTMPTQDELLASAAATQSNFENVLAPWLSMLGDRLSHTLASTSEAFGELFGARITARNGSVVAEIVAVPARVAAAPSLPAALTGTPIAQTIINQPVIERIRESVQTITVGGISEESLANSLQQLDNKLSSRIANVTASGNATYQVVAQTNKIDQLTGVDIYNSTLHGVSGLTASDIPTLSYFAATSTISIAYGGTGTSTLPTYGKMLLGNSLGGYDLVATSSLGISTSQWVTAGSDISYSTGSVGIGTTTPFYKLSVEGSSSLGNQAIAGYFTATSTTASVFPYASTTALTSSGSAYFATAGGSVGIGTTTPGSILSIGNTNGINFSTATSTFNSTGGINLAAGCFSVNNVCVGGAGTFLALSDTPASFNANRILYETSSAVTDNSGFTFDGTTFTVPGYTLANGTITYSSATKNIIQNNTASAWTLATSSTATPLLSIDTTTGSELVTIGKRGGSVQIGDSTTPTNLVFGGSSTISGSGLYTLTFGTTGDVIQYGVGIKPSTTNVFNLGASGSNWGCLYYNNSTLGTCASDERLKTAITDLSFDTATSSALDQLTGLRLRSFAYKSAPSSIYDGLIAQEVQAVAPELVVEDASTTMLAVKYGDIQWLTIAALQQLNAKFNALLGSASSTDQTVDTPPFFSRLLQWFASATNGIGDFFANRVRTRELCVTKADGTDACVSGDQLAAVLAGQSTAAAASAATPTVSTSPVITILGLNPAHIAVGSSYSDLGATVTDDTDTNLGIYISVDGGATTTPGLVSVDTTIAGTHSILYRVTDNDGNTTIATRQVIVGEVATSSVSTSTPATDSATSTPVVDTATSTDSTLSNTLDSNSATSSEQVSPSQTATSTTP